MIFPLQKQKYLQDYSKNQLAKWISGESDVNVTGMVIWKNWKNTGLSHYLEVKQPVSMTRYSAAE